MVDTLIVKKSLHKNKSEKIKLYKKKFLEYFLIRYNKYTKLPKGRCSRCLEFGPFNHLVGMRQLHLLWVNEANKQVIGPIVTKKLKSNKIWQWINKQTSEQVNWIFFLNKKIREKIRWVCCKSNKITKTIGICCGMRIFLKITKSNLMSVDEFMIN